MTRLDNFSFNEHKWIFGVCLAKDLCNETDMKLIVEIVNRLFDNQIFKLYDRNNINVIEYRNKNNEINSADFYLPRMIPLFFFFFQIIFIIVKIIPVKLFGWCLKRRYIRNSTKVDILLNKSFNDQISLKIKKCFSISEIFDDLIGSKKNELFQDGDMTYIKGIKGIGLFLFIIGFNFVVIYNHLLCKTGIKKIEKFMNTNRSAFFYGCLRLAPALILSSSGYSLSYKFLNFLDQKLANFNLDNNNKKTENNSSNKNDEKNNEKINNDKIEEKKENFLDNNISEENSNIINKEKNEEDKENSEYKSYIENSIGIKFYTEDISKKQLNAIFKGQKVGDDDVLSEISVNIIPYSFYFNFSLRQIHKLFLIPIGIVIFKYSVPLSTALFGNPLMQILYQDFFQKLGYAIGNYLYFGSFLDLFLEDTENIYMMRLFSIPMCELNFFVVCSIIIFIGYKKKWRIDIISIIIALVFFILKIIYIMIDIEKYNPAMYYVDSSYQRFFFNPVFNFDFYLIGVLFGLVNYVVQNDIAKKESLIKERPFSGIPIYLSKISDYKKNKNYIYFVIVIIFFLFLLFFTPQYFINNFDSVIEKNDPGYLFVILSSIDIEFITICFHYLALSSYVSGRNIFFDILVSPILRIPKEIEKFVSILTPDELTAKEIEEVVQNFIEEQGLHPVTESLLEEMANAFKGLSRYEINNILAMAVANHGELSKKDLSYIFEQKRQMVMKSGILEMVPVKESIEDIGGLENLKNWLSSKEKILHNMNKAQAYGVDIPKGVLIAGMPGCGKSLTAKAAAKAFDVPLLRLDIGRLMGKYLGESEGNMRRAIKLTDTRLALQNLSLISY